MLVAHPRPAAIAKLSGDIGLRPLLAGRSIATIPGGPGCIADIDDRAALRRLLLSRPRR